MLANVDEPELFEEPLCHDRIVIHFYSRKYFLMPSRDSESPQTLDGFGVPYEELLFYGQQHQLGKRVRSFNVLSLLGILNPHGSFCSGRSRYFSMVRCHSLSFNPHLFLQDYIVTFEEELNFVWRVLPRLLLAKLLFIAVGHITLSNVRPF